MSWLLLVVHTTACGSQFLLELNVDSLLLEGVRWLLRSPTASAAESRFRLLLAARRTGKANDCRTL